MEPRSVVSYQDIVDVSSPGMVFRSEQLACTRLPRNYSGYFGIEVSTGRFALWVRENGEMRPAAYAETGYKPRRDWAAEGAQVLRSFRIPPKLYDTAKQYAKRDGDSISAVLRHALTGYVREMEQREAADKLAHDRARLTYEEDDLLG